MKNDIPGLRQLWKLAFGDTDEFLDSFFSTAYSPERCHLLKVDNRVAAALYWFPCSCSDQKIAYIYAVATHPDHRGKGLCSQLMGTAHEVLRQQGYAAAMLQPADPGLRRMYRKMGYRTATCISEFTCSASEPIPLRKISPEEYGILRRRLLPEGGLIQEGTSLTYLHSYATLYAGADFLLAGAVIDGAFVGMELLGSRDAAPGILGALGVETGSFRCPGSDIPFGMFLPLTEDAKEPAYLGLVFD